MKLPSRPRHDPSLPGVSGTARVDRRTRSLLPRLQPGDIAVLDHLDMDRASAQALADADVVAVVNASRFVSGRYPNLGPAVLLDAGIVLVDGVGQGVFGGVGDGQAIRLRDGAVLAGDREIASGRVVDLTVLNAELDEARGGLGSQLESFTHNSTEFLRREQELLLHGRGAPRIRTRLADRAVVVAVGGPHHESELAGLKRYLREQHPVLIGVDAGADALLAIGRKPDVVVVSSPHLADPADRVSAKALRGARDVVVVVDRGIGKVPTDSLERLGVRPHHFETGATAEDAALMLASLGGASLIVGAGVHASLDDFLDRQRGGLASTFLTRLKVGPELVDARAVPQLYAGRVRIWHLWLVLLAGLLAVLAAVAVTPVGQEWFDDLRPALSDLFADVEGLF
jgi:uncharacterized membrane-anchored protein